MRGNSGFLRLAVIGWLSVCSVSGGPPRPRRMMRETFSSTIQELVPMSFNTTEGSGMCTYNGKEVLRSSVTCEKKNGCREIETHGECCPKFLCECKLNGTVYDNGDKIVDPENPCEVCVCRGGDINCNALKCYSRNDCKNVTYTPGVCCPEYMNCPPLENVELNSSNETTLSTENSIISSSSTILSIETSTPVLTTTTTTSPEISTQSNDVPVGIKIKEITKPEEIRITDDRPKVFKPIKSSEVLSTKSSPSLLSAEIIIDPEYPIEHQSLPAMIPDESSEAQQEIEPEIEQHTTFSFDDNADEPIQLESTDLNTGLDVSMGPKIVRQTDNGNDDEIQTTIAPPSSENEIKDDMQTTRPEHFTEAPVESTTVMHNTSVLQVGDSVVIFDRSGQTQSIPLRVAGLQRGEDTYDEEDERKEARKSDDNVPHSTSEFTENSSTDSMLDQSTTTVVYEVQYFPPNYDYISSEINTASGEGFINDVKLNQDLKDGISSKSLADTSLTSTEDMSVFFKDGSGDSQYTGTSSEETTTVQDIDGSSGDSSIDAFTDQNQAPSTVYQRILNVPTDFNIEGSSSTSEEMSSDEFATPTFPMPLYSSEPTTTNDDDDIVQHENINYPHIMDDLSIHGSRMEDRIEEDEKLRASSRVVEGELEIQPIEQNSLTSPESLAIITNTSIVDSLSTEAPLENLKESSKFNDIEGRSPGEPLLIPEWERNHTTVAPFELLSVSNEASDDNKSSELSSHSSESVLGDESTTSRSDLSSSTDIIETQSTTSDSQSNSDVESVDSQQTSGPSQVKETNHLNLFLDGTADFLRIQKKIWDSAVA